MEREGWNAEECKNIELVSDKLCTQKALYQKAKGDSIDVIRSQIQRSSNRFTSLLKEHTTARAMWEAIKAEFEVTRASEIGRIAARVMSKSILEFSSIEEYCRAYQEAYEEISSLVANKNGHQQQFPQEKSYEVLLQGAMLHKLPDCYAMFISAMDEEWSDYTHADLSHTIHRVTRYLKNDPFKGNLHNVSSNANSGIKGKAAVPNKRHRLV